MEEWRKVRRKKKCKVARPNDKLVVGTKMLYKKRIRQDREASQGDFTLHIAPSCCDCSSMLPVVAPDLSPEAILKW